MGRVLAFAYGAVSYVVFLATFLYAIGFVGDLVVPKTVDAGGAAAPGSGAFWPSLLVNLALLGLFAVQHSGMARPGFKRRWTKIVPESIERSTFVLLASLVLILLFWLWRPMPEVVWRVEGELGRGLLWGLFGLGWAIVLVSTFMISHGHLFGLRQVHDALKGREPSRPEFQTPGLYRVVRHPIMVGFLVAFWATPTMTVGHLLFAAATTGYILLAVRLEERDLVRAFGERYERYRERVPGFLPGLSLPSFSPRRESSPGSASSHSSASRSS